MAEYIVAIVVAIVVVITIAALLLFVYSLIRVGGICSAAEEAAYRAHRTRLNEEKIASDTEEQAR